ncbi:MAG: nucleotidyltransferase domain-containing protein [Chloroflexi bacterium]|nr:nucleotidyltransferase domain-containing protein [Chloroflexota bacterium]
MAKLCQKYNVAILYVFGSRAEEVRQWIAGETAVLPSSPSDVDIGVQTIPAAPFGLDEKVRLALELEDFLGVTRVDLVSFHNADPFLAANIIRGERLYARNTHEADEFDLYILRRAGDLAPLERERMAFILGEAT